MSTVSKLVLPAPVLDLRQRLEEWRHSRPKLESIPAELWHDAAHLARSYGIHRVARALRLEFNALKRHLDVECRQHRKPSPPLAFLEVSMPPGAVVPSEYLVEMERPDGGRMNVRLTDQAGVVALSDSFWRCRS